MDHKALPIKDYPHEKDAIWRDKFVRTRALTGSNAGSVFREALLCCLKSVPQLMTAESCSVESRRGQAHLVMVFPRAVPLDEAQLEEHELDVVFGDVLDALRALHAHGLAHTRVSKQHILVHQGRGRLSGLREVIPLDDNTDLADLASLWPVTASGQAPAQGPGPVPRLGEAFRACGRDWNALLEMVAEGRYGDSGMQQLAKSTINTLCLHESSKLCVVSRAYRCVDEFLDFAPSEQQQILSLMEGLCLDPDLDEARASLLEAVRHKRKIQIKGEDHAARVHMMCEAFEAMRTRVLGRPCSNEALVDHLFFMLEWIKRMARYPEDAQEEAQDLIAEAQYSLLMAQALRGSV